jgi:DNA repair protein RadC
MTPDSTARCVSTSRYAAIRDSVRCRVPAVADGGLVAFFLDAAGEVILRVVLDEGTRHVDDLFLRHLTALIAEIDAASVVLASVRSDGQPRRADRVLWREMRVRLADAHSVLADLLIVGEDRCWSAATRRRLRPDVPAAAR